MSFRINRGIFQFKDNASDTFINKFKIDDRGEMIEVDPDGNKVAAYMRIGDQATDSDKLDGYHATNAGGGIPVLNSNGYWDAPSWINVRGTGLYSSTTNGAHFVPNTQSYGSWNITGTRNGWVGLHFGGSNGATLMMNETETGIHRQGSGWKYRHTGGKFYVHTGTNGGGTGYPVWHEGTISTSEVSALKTSLGVTGLPYSCDIFVEGDPNLYYPVHFRGGDQNVWRRIIIKRSYSEAAPPDWNTATHKGGLLLDWEGNFGGWGGATYTDRLRTFNESYSNICASMYRTTHSMGYTFFLRGGGAVYHIYSDQAINGTHQSGTPDIAYDTSFKLYDNANASYIVYAPAPMDRQDVGRINSLRTLKRSELDSIYQPAGSYLTTSGKAADSNLLDGVNSTSFLRSDQDDTMSGTLTITGSNGVSRLRIEGTTPTIDLDDADGDSFYIHVNSNNFYVLADRNGGGNYGDWETQHPMQINAGTSAVYFFGNKINSAAYQASSAFDSAGSAAGVDARINNEVLPQLAELGTNKADASHTHFKLVNESANGYSLLYNKGNELNAYDNTGASTNLYINYRGGTVYVEGGNSVVHSGNIGSQSVSSATTSTYLGGYYHADTWLRAKGDSTTVKFYGNSRMMVFRTDGEGGDTGHTGYAFKWTYGGDGTGATRMLLDNNGNLWTSSYGWLHSRFETAGAADAVRTDLSGLISTATSTADTASSTASTANTTANSALAAATTAQDTADEATSLARAAQTTADGKLGSTAKAADSNLLDGIDSGSFLRSDANDTFTGTLTMGKQHALVANNYGRGVYGVYSATRYQHVWSMGTAYNLADNGTGAGNLYGLAWTHTNVGGQSKSGLSHQLLLMMNGTTYTALGNGIWTQGTITTASHGTSANWNTAYGWGNHAGLYDSAGSAAGVDARINEEVLPQVTTNATNIARNATELASKLGTTGKAADSNLLDGINSTSFLRSDTNDTAGGNITLKYNTANAEGYNALNFAPYDDAAGLNDYIIKASSSRGVFGRKSFGWHVHSSSAFGIYSNGWKKLFGVEGDTGNAFAIGSFNANQLTVSGSTNSGRFYADEWGIKIGTSSGHIQFGPANNDWAHIYTDRPNFYFNKNIYVNNAILSTRSWAQDAANTAQAAAIEHSDTRIETEILPAIDGKLDATAKAADSNLLDGIDSSAFIRENQDRRHKVIRFTGESGNSGNPVINYGIYQEGGAWTHPYPDLVIGMHTGIKIGGYYGYNGTRFYNDAPGRSGASEIFSVGDGDSNVRVANNLHIGSAGGWITDLLNAKANVSHDHNDLYYTKAQSNANYDAAGSASTAQSNAIAAAGDRIDNEVMPQVTTNATNIARNATALADKAAAGGSYGQDFAADDMYVDQWFRNTVSGKGLYNEATTQHFYSDSDDYWNVAGGTGANGIRFRDEHNGTVRGYLYANNGNQVGILDAGGSWAIRHTNDAATEFYDADERVFSIGQGGHGSNYGTVCTHGDGRGGWEGYSINERFVWMSSDNTLCGMYNDLDNEWMTQYHRNGAVKLYHNGGLRLETQSGGAKVHGTMTATAFSGSLDWSNVTNKPVIPAATEPVQVTVDRGENSTLSSIFFNPGEGVATFTLADGQTFRLAFAR